MASSVECLGVVVLELPLPLVFLIFGQAIWKIKNKVSWQCVGCRTAKWVQLVRVCAQLVAEGHLRDPSLGRLESAAQPTTSTAKDPPAAMTWAIADPIAPPDPCHCGRHQDPDLSRRGGHANQGPRATRTPARPLIPRRSRRRRGHDLCHRRRRRKPGIVHRGHPPPTIGLGRHGRHHVLPAPVRSGRRPRYWPPRRPRPRRPRPRPRPQVTTTTSTASTTTAAAAAIGSPPDACAPRPRAPHAPPDSRRKSRFPMRPPVVPLLPPPLRRRARLLRLDREGAPRHGLLLAVAAPRREISPSSAGTCQTTADKPQPWPRPRQTTWWPGPRPL